MVSPYAEATAVRKYVRSLSDESNDLQDDEIDEYTMAEDRFTVDVALATGMRVDVPLTNPPDVIKVLSAKCSALAIIRAYYGGNPPSDLDVNSLKGEVEQFLHLLRMGEINL